jgi:hypothetical protein
MSNLNQKQQPVYVEGKVCKKCGTTTKLVVKKKRPFQKNNVIFYTEEIYKSIRCVQCYRTQRSRKNNKNSLEWQRKHREHLRAYQREYYKDKYQYRKN